MASPLILGAAAAAAVALWLGTMGHASELRRLREELDEARRPPTPPGGARGRGSRERFTALVQPEQTSPWSRLQAVPGGTALAAAAVFTLLAIALVLREPAATPAPAATASELQALQATVDSMRSSVALLRDSLRLAVEQDPAAPGREVRTRVAGRSGSAGGLGVLPPPAKLPPAVKLDSVAH